MTTHAPWYSMQDLPAGSLRVRVRWAGYVVLAASNVDQKGRRVWHEIRGTDLTPLPATPEAWQPETLEKWRWPNGIEPVPLPVQVVPRFHSEETSFDAAAAAAEMEDWREAARASGGDRQPVEMGQWWRDVTRVAYEPMGGVSLRMGEARILRHLILERSMPNDLRRQKSNAAVLADLKLSWADIYGAQSRGDDWTPPLVAQPQDWRDFDTVMGWFCEVAPNSREMTILRGRMMSPPATWRQLGDEIGRSWQRAQQLYKQSIKDLVEAANTPRHRAVARIAEVQERNRAARRQP